MFEKINQFLAGTASLGVESSGQPTARDLQIATAALLVKMAFVDERLADEEMKALVGNLNRQFHLSDTEAGDLLEVADYLRRDQAKLSELINLIHKRFEEAQRITIVAMLCRVMHADGVVTKLEAHLASEVAQSLKLSIAQIEAAQEMAETGQV
ncbi:MAG: TerB family tellurite resistance protein [Bdellovibrionales bacterium]|nr:TerB family tellurite resistance protein [Bdellovibrionales bacterium]